MNDLPILALSKIFSYLNPKERAKFRRVNKTWKWLIDGIRQENLCVCLPEFNWRLGFNERDVFEVSLYDSNELKFDYFQKPDTQQNLRRLHVFYDSHRIFPLDLNLFSQLEVLELHDYSDQLEIREELNLPNLKGLALISTTFSRPVRVNSDHLTNLRICDEPRNSLKSPVHLKRPKALKFLQCTMFISDFKEFTNLEHLIALQVLVPLSPFRKLKRLEIYSSKRWNSQPLFDELKTNRHHFRPDLEVFINGFRGNSPNCKFIYMWIGGNLLLCKEVFEELSNGNSAGAAYSMPWRTSILEYQDHSIPSTCLDAFFTNVDEVNVHTKVDSANLIRFLKATRTASTLRLLECSLEQFYDQLPSVTTIRRLFITESSTSIEFGFLLEMKYLGRLSLEYPRLPIQTIYRKLKMNWAFNRFDFYLSSHLKRDLGFTLYARDSERKLNYFRMHKSPYKEDEVMVALDDIVGALERDGRFKEWLL